jgi:hypothetical protein
MNSIRKELTLNQSFCANRLYEYKLWIRVGILSPVNGFSLCRPAQIEIPSSGGARNYGDASEILESGWDRLVNIAEVVQYMLRQGTNWKMSLQRKMKKYFKTKSVSSAGIHKQFGAKKKTGSELIFLRIDFKISFFLFLQMLFTENVSVWRVSSKRSVFLEKN